MSLDDFDKIVSSGSINFCAPLSFQSKLSLFASLENNELLRLFQLSQNANMKIAPSHAPYHSTHKIIRDLTLQKVFSFCFCMKSHIGIYFFKFIDFFFKKEKLERSFLLTGWCWCRMTSFFPPGVSLLGFPSTEFTPSKLF